MQKYAKQVLFSSYDVLKKISAQRLDPKSFLVRVFFDEEVLSLSYLKTRCMLKDRSNLMS